MKHIVNHTTDITIRFAQRTLICVTLAIFGFASPGYADDFVLTKTVVSGGGGRMSDLEESFVLTFTIGQPAAGATGGGDFGLGVGFFPPPPPACQVASAPEPDRLDLPSDPINQMMRYLSFKIAEADAGREQALRVTMVNLPAPYDTWNGTKMFVGPPEVFCENAGQVNPPCAPAEPRTEWTGATLQCSAEVRDWSAEGVVYVYHEGIIPGGQYDVQVANSECDLAADASYSEPLEMTQSRWGDLVSNCVTCPCGPPDGSVGIPTDVTAVLDKFKNLALFDCYAPVKVRAEHDRCTPDQRIDIPDVMFCLDAFRGFPYPPVPFADCMSTEPPCQPGGECY